MIKQKYNQHKETIYNFTWRALQIGAKQGIVFLIFIISAKLLIPYEFGVFNYLLAIVFLLIIFGDFGISTATSKYVAEYNVKDKEKLKSILFNSGLIILSLTVIITFLAFLIGPYFLKESSSYLIYLLPLIFLTPMTSLYDGIYRGLKQFKKLAIISSVVGIISLGFVYILIKEYGLIGALISQNLFYFLLLIGLGLGYREFSFKIDKGLMKEISKYSLIIGIGTLGYYLYTRVNLIFLGSFGFIEEVGYFELANKIFLFLSVPFFILGQVIAPRITEYVSKRKHKEVQLKYLKYVSFVLIVGILITLILFFVSQPLINLFLKEYTTENFLKIYNAMLFILPLTFLTSTLSQGFTISTGKAKYMLLTIPFGIFNIIVTYFLIIQIGFMGAVYGVIISTTLTRFLTYILLYKDLRRTANETKK